MPVGPGGGTGAAGVDDHELSALALSAAQVGHEMGRGADRVVAPEDDELAVHHVGIGLAVARAQRQLHRGFGGRAANAALQCADTEAVPEPGAGDGHLHQSQGAAVAVGQNGLGPVLLNNLRPAVANQRNGLIPTHTLPLARALRPHAAQRVLQPVGMVDVVQIGAHLGAEPAFGDGVVGVAVEIYRPPILHLGDDAAGVGAVVGAGAADEGEGRLEIGDWRLER